MYQPSQGTELDTVVIASSGTTSTAADLGDFSLAGIIVPIMTGTALTFQVSTDGVTYHTLHDSTKAAVTVTVDGTARAFYLEPVKFAGWRFIKVVSGSAEGAERTITLVSVKAVNKR